MNSIKWFDENGNEIIQKPINYDETDFIAEIGGNFEEFSVGLNFYSETLDKHEITKLLGVEPTKSWNPYEKHPIGKSKKTRVVDFGKWYLTSIRDDIELNKKLKNLLESLTQDLDVWKTLTSKYQVWIDVAGYMENWNRGFTLNIETMKMLTERNLKIEFDIYYNGEEDVNEK